MKTACSILFRYAMIIWLSAFVAGLGIFLGNMFYGGYIEDEPVRVEHVQWGVIKNISGCHQAGKYAYRCKVETDKYTFPRLDVTRFPDENLNEGDKIYSQTLIYSRTLKSSNCKNAMCLAQGHAFFPMPAFNKHEKIDIGVVEYAVYLTFFIFVFYCVRKWINAAWRAGAFAPPGARHHHADNVF